MPLRRLIPAVLALLTTGLLTAMPAMAQRFNVLVFSKTAGFRHASIPDGIEAIRALGQQHGFTVEATEDAAVFTDEGLARYGVVVFLSTTGTILNTAQKAAFERYIRGGGGFAGVHAAADTEYDWPFYGRLVGAYFHSHPEIQGATVKVADRVHPSTAHLPKRWTRTDEWYNFRINPRGNVHVLATLDEKTYRGGNMGHDHPIAWCHPYEGGRSWYTAGGHTSESFREPLFLQHLLGGIRYAAGVEGGDCSATRHGSFQKTILETNVDDAVDLAVLPDGRVLFVEMDGSLRLHDPATAATRTAAQLSVWEGNENGLLGVALDPGFARNGWLYLFYTPAGPASKQRVSRFTFTGSVLEPGSERVLLEVPIVREQCCHAAGSMAFDGDGNLLIALGDDTNPFESDGFTPIDERPGRAPWDAQRSSGNTADLRGKILRIRPLPDGTYGIPEGNLFPNGAGGRPEIYVMGIRNPYRISVDRRTGWLYWGDVGPDARTATTARGPQGLDEWNQARGPGNFGWPYCIGPNLPYRDFDFATRTSGPAFSCAAPVNDSPNNTGSRTLPPAQPAWIWYPYGASPDFPEIPPGNGRTAMAGPVYQYDERLRSETKLPAYYDGTLFLFEWSRNVVLEVKLDDDGQPLEINPFAPEVPLARPISMRFGPDGALYVLEWGSGFTGSNRDAQLVRIDYRSGPRAPVAVLQAGPTSGPVPLRVTFSASGSFDPDGDALGYAWDFEADGVVDATGPEASHTFPVAGAYTAQLIVTDGSGQHGLATVTVVAGNTRPEVAVIEPPDGGFFSWGDVIPFRITASDAEDGSTATGEIACGDLTFQQYVGHDDHSHPTSPAHSCEGTVETPAGHGGEGDNIFLVVEARYTDGGAPGTIALDARVQHRLNPRRLQAEHATTNGGVTLQNTQDPEGGRSHLSGIDDGDYIVFEGLNLRRIGFVTYRVASGGTGGRIEVRADAPEGPLLSTAHVEWTGGWNAFRDVTTPITDPGGTRDLFFVFRRSPGNTSLFNLNWIDFHGRGVSDRTARGEEGLTATYFGSPDFSGPATSRLDPQISFNWSTDAPLPSVRPDSFSVRWTGQVMVEADEAYTFHARSGDAMRLWLGGRLLIDRPASASVGETSSVPVSLASGERYDLTVELTHGAGAAQAHVLWSSASTPKATVPARLLYPDATTGTSAREDVVSDLLLEPVSPNPIATRATFAYTLPAPAPVKLEVFDLLGRKVAVLEDGFRAAGRHALTFSPEALPSGVYLFRLTTPAGTRTRHAVVAR